MEHLNCYICNNRVPSSLDGLVHHLISVHGLTITRGAGPAGFECGQDGCRRRYQHFYSLRRHIRNNHLIHAQIEPDEPADQVIDNDNIRENELNYIVNNGDIVVDNNEDRIEDEQNVSLTDRDDNDLKSYVIRMVARFQCKQSMTSKTVTEILDECEQLVLATRMFLKKQVHRYFQEKGLLGDNDAQNVLDAFELKSPFDGLRTLDDQITTLKNYCEYIEPVEIPLGYRMDTILNRKTGTYKPKMVMETFQYVPLLDTLKLVLSSQQVRQAIDNEQKSPNGILASYLDGQYAQVHGLFSLYPNAIRIQLYYDEFEIVNPLGSKTGVHKLGAFYFNIQNVPSHMNSELNSIHVLCLCADVDVKKYGFEAILSPFLEDLSKIESDEGFLIDVGGSEYVLRGSIVAFCGDSLAVHDVYNLLGPSARQFCRMCMYNRENLHSGSIQLGQERNEQLYNEHLALLRNTNFSQEAITETGVRGTCCLNDSRYFHIAINRVFDPMHDFLCGICPMIIKLVLYEFVLVQRKFDITYFNAKISSFAWGYTEKVNKPSANFTEAMLRKREHTLSQKAMQIWCLIRAFPFLVYGKIATEDEHMDLLLTLLRIMEIVFAPKVTYSLMPYLNQLIITFFAIFRRLFPDIHPINKMHHIFHYPDCIMWSGPQILYWCMRFEAKHNVMKSRAQVVHNFKKPPKTLIRIAQCGQSAKWGMKDVELSEITTSCGKRTNVANTLSRQFLYDINYVDTDEVFCSKRVQINGVEFRLNLYVCLEVARVRDDDLPLFGHVKEIVILHNTVFLLTLICTSLSFNPDLNAYHIRNDDTGHYRFIEVANLPYFKPLCCWTKPGSPEAINGSAFLELTEDDLTSLKIKLGPRKILLKLIKSIKQSEDIIGSYVVDKSGSMIKLNEDTPRHLDGVICASKPSSSNHPQADHNVALTSNSSARFSHFRTVEETLQQHQQGRDLINAARNNTFTENDRKALVRMLCSALKSYHGHLYPPVDAKMALAEAIVREFPLLRDAHTTNGYEHYFDRETKTGFIEYHLWNERRNLSPSKKKYKVVSKKKIKKCDNSDETTNNNLTDEAVNEKISTLKHKNPTDKNKNEIIQLLEETYSSRRHWIQNSKPTIAEIFQTYPRLRDYNGEMIESEFAKMFPQSANNFLAKFPTYYVPRILQYAKHNNVALYNTSKMIESENLRALLLLAHMLPVSNATIRRKGDNPDLKRKGKKRCHDSEENMNTEDEQVDPLIVEFPNPHLLRFVSEGTNLPNFEETVRKSLQKIFNHIFFWWLVKEKILFSYKAMVYSSALLTISIQ